MGDLRADARRQVGRVLSWFEASLPGRWWARLLEMEFVDRSVALAAKAFVAFLPALVVVAAYLPGQPRRSLASALQHRLGLSGTSLEVVQATLTTGAQTRSATSVIGLLLTLFYATTFTTALQRLYLRAWRRPPMRDRRRPLTGLAWVVGVIVLMSLLGGLRRVLHGWALTGVLTALAAAGSLALWWWTHYVMLQSQVRWRVLLPGAILTTVGSNLYGIGAAVWLPRNIIASQQQFGFFGVAMALVSWFVGLAFVLVGAAALGVVLAEDSGRIGRLIRGSEVTSLRPGALPPLPAPSRPGALLDAFGRQSPPPA
jgi:membrane protein